MSNQSTTNQEEVSIPATLVPIVIVQNEHNQHIFSRDVIFSEVEYCGHKVKTGPVMFNTPIDLRRDTCNQELLDAGVLSKRDQFVGTPKVASVTFLDRSINAKVTIILPDYRESDVTKVNDHLYSVSYGMEIHDLPPGDPTVRCFQYTVKGCLVKFIISMQGAVDLKEGICFIDTDGSFDGVGFDIYGVKDKEGAVVHYEDVKHKEIREFIKANFKLMGYNLELQRTLKKRVVVNSFDELSGAAQDVLIKLVTKGAQDDGDLPAKSGMNELITLGLAIKDYDSSLPNIVTEKGKALYRTKPLEEQFWTTPLVPIKTEANADKFSKTALVGMEMVNGIPITIPPYAIGEPFDALSLSQTKELLEGGFVQQTDSIKPGAQISSVFISTSLGVIELKRGTPQLLSVGLTNVISNRIETSSKELFSSILFIEDVVKKSRYDCPNFETTKVTISFNVDFKVENETGNVFTFFSDVSVDALSDVDGNPLPLIDEVKVIFFDKISIVGYHINGQRINYNKPIGNK